MQSIMWSEYPEKWWFVLHWGSLIPVRRVSGPWLFPMLLTYTIIFPTSPMLNLQKNFWQLPIPPIFLSIILAHGDALYVSWNQYCRMVTNFLSGCQSLVYIGIGVSPLYMPAQWAWSVIYILATSALNYIWYLMTILRLCIKERINDLHFGHDWSPVNHEIVNIMMRTMFLALLMSGWSYQLWNLEVKSNHKGTLISQFRRKSGLIIQ